MKLPTKEILDQIVTVCRSCGQGNVGGESHREWFDEVMAAYTRKRFDDDTRGLLAAVEREGRRGLIAARHGELLKADALLSEAQRILESAPVSEEAHLLAESMLCAQCAYYEFRRGNDAHAYELLERSFRNDLVLENQLGYHALHIHRVQLVHNTMRIAIRRGNLFSGIWLGHAVLAYLENPDRRELNELTTPWCLGWTGGFAEHLPRELVRAMHAQVAGDVVGVFADATKDRALRQRIADDFSPKQGGAVVGTQIDQWITFRLAQLDGSYGDPFIVGVALLRRGAEPSAPLWRSAAEGLIRLMSEVAAELG